MGVSANFNAIGPTNKRMIAITATKSGKIALVAAVFAVSSAF
jgi:hypothetical protein